MKVKLGEILIEQKKSIGKPDGGNLNLIGVSNEIGLHISRAPRIADLSRYKLIEKDWFAYNPMRVNVGSIGYASSDEHIGIVSPDYVVFSCSDKIMPDYLLYLLKSDEGKEAINKNASGAVRKRLYFSDLAEIEIVLPSIEDQKRRLVAFSKIAYLKSTINSETKKESLLQKLKQAILQEAIQGKLTADWRAQNPDVEPASELLKRIKAEKERLVKEKKIKKEKPLPPITTNEIPFELPNGWIWCRLGELLLGSDAGKSPNCEKRPARGNEWGVLTTTSIQLGFFDQKANKVLPANFEINPTQVVQAEDILITRAGPLNRTGVCCKVDVISYNLILSDKTIRLKHVAGMVSPDFIVDTINSKQIRNLLIPSMTGMAESQVNISQDNIKSIPFPLAPYEEQKAIFEKTVSLIEKCRKLEAEIIKSKAHGQMLMQAVLKEAFEPAAVTDPEAEDSIAMAAEPAEAFGKRGEFGF